VSTHDAPSEDRPFTTTAARETQDARAYAALLTMCLIWGSTFLVIRIGNETVSPLWAATVRLLLAVPLYLAVAVVTSAPFGGRAAVRTALTYGALNFGVNFALLYWGEQRVPSGTAAVIYATIPLTTAIFAPSLPPPPCASRKKLNRER